jgi:hypothetical protein
VWFRRGRLFMVSPDSLGAACPLSGRNSTYRSVQISETSSVMLLHDGTLPGALANRPNTAFTRSLLDDAKERIPRLKWDLTEVGLRNFLTDLETIGVACTKYRASIGNGWSFPPLGELREAWSRRYGPVKWDNPEAKEWSKKGMM